MHDIFAFSDIHGMWDLYKAIMDYCHEQDPEYSLIFLGDAIDRGSDGYQIMKELLDNPKVVYLKGNHEDMFTKAAREIKHFFSFKDANIEKIHEVLNACRYFDYKYVEIQDSLGNGGLTTLTDWILDGMPMDIVERIEKLPLTFSTDIYDFCHAAGIYKTFKEAADAEYDGKEVDQYTRDSLLWSRSAFEYGWEPNHTVIYGHTPVPYLLEDLHVKWDKSKNVEPYKYVGKINPTMTGAKIDMDTGAAFTGIAYVLNVLTMKAYGFKDLDFKNKDIEKHRIEKIKVIQL